MAKGSNMALFVLALVVAGPIGLVAGIIGIGWLWEYVAGCFFSLSYACGQGELLKGMLFGAVSIGSLNLIKNTWDKSK